MQHIEVVMPRESVDLRQQRPQGFWMLLLGHDPVDCGFSAPTWNARLLTLTVVILDLVAHTTADMLDGTS